MRSNWSLRFARTLNEAGWTSPAEWHGESNSATWLAVVIGAVIGAGVLWVFLVAILGVEEPRPDRWTAEAAGRHAATYARNCTR